MNKKNDIWFPAKKYGYGWGLPVRWEGWVVLASYLVLMMAGSLILIAVPVLIPFFIRYTALISAILVFICWKKGEKK